MPGSSCAAEKKEPESARQEGLPQFDSPFVDALGIARVICSGGECELVLPLKRAHLNQWGIAHGGISMTLSDVALAMAARSVAETDIGVLTIELKVSFLQPGRELLHAKGRVLHRTSKMAYCEGEIIDKEGCIVAKALGTFKYVKKRQEEGAA
nr:PaaI family thioesterase [Caballeronia sp. GAOx1]